MATEKLCLFCKHFYLDTGSPGYSEYTPGTDFHMECFKNHWKFGVGDSESHYRACLISAEVCQDYEINADLLQIKPAFKGK